ncbi:MAG TPA: cytidylate kinase-like family protein [Ruminococcaceae bacterium]|nr:cytidylate kinase-like family protein [Oscillospiraceae bacterium]
MEKFIVTIARGFGSGGRTIGKMLADKLGIEFYDKDLIRIASDVSGINEALFGQNDEKTKAGVFGKPGVYKGGVIAPGKSGFISEENLFNYQAMVIKQICEEKSAVIVGRCADYVLSGRKNVVRVFIYADEENCIKNAADVKGITDRKEALRTIASTDKERAAYYKAHTGRDWIDARNYDLCLNSGDLGFEKCVEIICDFIKIKLG